MLSNLILNNDDFIDMPTDAQMLYVRLNMAADDRGICDSPRSVMRACGASNDSMKLLITKKFILIPQRRKSVIVIKHWWINNSMKKDRFKETKYTDVLDELFYDDNKSYSQNPEDGHISCVRDGKLIWPPDIPELLEEERRNLLPEETKPETPCIQAGNNVYPQNRLDQNRLDQVSVGKVRSRKQEDEIFTAFWDAYPKKTGDIKQAYQEYLFALDEATPEQLLTALQSQVEASSEKDLQYFPSADKWLRNRSWLKPIKAKKPPRTFVKTEFD